MVFQCIIKLTMSFKTLLLTVIPKRYYCQRSCFSKKYQNGITVKAIVSNVISSKWFFKVLLNWRLSVKTMFLTVIPTRYYCQKQCFSKKYECFQSTVFKIVFQCSIELTESFKTLLLAVIPKRYYCQSIVFQRNTEMVLLSKLMFPM